MVSLDGLIISAGYSSRMKHFKPLMKYNGIPFLLSIIIKLSNVCQNIVVVIGYQADNLKKEITHWLSQSPEDSWLKLGNLTEKSWFNLSQRINIQYNQDFNLGMFSSLQYGLQQLPNPEWVLYHFVDQPHIPKHFYSKFVTQITSNCNWIQPVYKGRKAHPIIFDSVVINTILKANPTTSLNTLTQKSRFKKKYWNCQFPEIIQDLDTPLDLMKQ